MKTRSKLFSVILSLVLTVVLCPIQAFAGETGLSIAGAKLTVQSTATMTQPEHNSKSSAFVNDERWRDGVSFSNAQGPKLSTYGSAGCFAYACDFTKYMYGIDSILSGSSFSNKNDIRQGDVIQVNSGGHTIVVLSRNGNSLYTAEGNYAGKVRVANGAYTVSDLNFSSGWHYADIQAVNHDPIGAFDECWGDGNCLVVRGWAYDSDSPNAATRIHVYVGGPAGSDASKYTFDASGKELVANLDRRDLGKACGYDYTIPVKEAGNQSVYVYAINNEGGNNPLLTGGPKTVAIGANDNPGPIDRVSFDAAVARRRFPASR